MPDYIDPASFEDDEQLINLREYLHILWKRKGLIVLVLLIAVAVAMIKNYKAVPYYSASSQVLIERNYGSRGLDNQTYYGWEYSFLETQSEIIRSVNVGRKVVENLGLTDKYRRYFFASDANTNQESSFLGSTLDGLKKQIKAGLSFFASGDAAEVKSDSGESGDARIETVPLSEIDQVARRISGGLSVSPVEDTQIVSISYTDKDPAIAQMITNAVVKGYMAEMLEIKLASTSYQLNWMTDKAEQEREKLERSERALQKYMRDNDLVTLEDRLTIYPQKLSEFSSQLSRVEAERKELQSLLDQIEEAGGDFDRLEKIPVFADSAVLTEVREEIYRANQKIKELSQKYGPKHPVMIKARDDVKVLQQEKRFEIQRIVDATRNSYNLADSREENVKELLDRTKSEVLNLNEKFVQYSILKREVDANRLLYDTLQTNIKKENITEQTQSVNIWVVQEADLPSSPSYPNKRRTLLMAAAFGLFGGLGLAFLIEYLDNTVKSEAELEKRFGRTVLGSVEKVDKKGPSIESYIVEEPLSPLAESYRLIRSGLLLSSAEKPPCTIVVTSMNQGDGKTATTLNLARVLIQDNRTVLIIGCDLRRPRMHGLFGLDNKEGLTSYLSGNIEEIPVRNAPDEDLDVIVAGPIPPNPAELLSSNKMKALMDKMADKYDFVLLDAPPVQSVTDALPLASEADGTIVVAQYGKTTYDMMTSGMKKLGDMNAHVLGFVINGLKKGEAGSYYYGYSGYYKKYS